MDLVTSPKTKFRLAVMALVLGFVACTLMPTHKALSAPDASWTAAQILDDAETGPEVDAPLDVVVAAPLLVRSASAATTPPVPPARHSSLPAYLKYAALLL